MQTSLTARELLWDEQQRADRIRKVRDRRAWLTRFALVFALIVLTLGVARYFAGLASDSQAF